MMQNSLTLIKNACAAIEVNGKRRGTGYLIAPEWVATCQHVIHPLQQGDHVVLRFPSGDRSAVVAGIEPIADCAVLRLDAPLRGVAPLRRGPSCSAGAPWLAYGFPEVAGQAGVLIEGTVRDPQTKDPRDSPALQLYSPDAAAGKGARLHGFSGAPVVVRGTVVGHLKQVIVDVTGEDPFRSELGLVYACPIEYVERLAPLVPSERRRPPQPPGAAYDPTWYVHREREEKIALGHLALPGAPAVVWGPRSFGRTTLIRYLLHYCQQQDLQEGKQSRCVAVHLELFDNSSWVSFDKFLRELATRIVGAVEGSHDWVERAWQKPGVPADKLSRLMEENILPLSEERFILAIDQADAVWIRRLFHDDFFGMLRGWSEEGSEPWSRLRLLLSVSTAPTLLVKTTTQSPFNTAVTIDLRDLHSGEVRKLADMYGLDWSDEEIKLLMEQVGGHPYLVRLAMYKAAMLEPTASLTSLLNDSYTDGEVFSEYIQRMRFFLQEHPDLIEALSLILTCRAKNQECPLDLITYLRLRSAGLIVEERPGVYRLRYRLYEEPIRRLCQWTRP